MQQQTTYLAFLSWSLMQMQAILGVALRILNKIQKLNKEANKEENENLASTRQALIRGSAKELVYVLPASEPDDGGVSVVFAICYRAPTGTYSSPRGTRDIGRSGGEG